MAVTKHPVSDARFLRNNDTGQVHVVLKDDWGANPAMWPTGMNEGSPGYAMAYELLPTNEWEVGPTGEARRKSTSTTASTPTRRGRKSSKEPSSTSTASESTPE